MTTQNRRESLGASVAGVAGARVKPSGLPAHVLAVSTQGQRSRANGMNETDLPSGSLL
jgi:hypothetical protein